MPASDKLKHIGAELKGHAPFTTAGALLGIIFMLIFHKIGKPEPATLFGIFHPLHVLLSAMVTASLFRIHENKKHILTIIVIGYVGSIGIATLSDCIVPYIGEKMLGLDMPTHADLHVVNEPAATEIDEHAGHDHEAIVTPEDEHAGHDHDPIVTTEDDHAGHDHAADIQSEDDSHAGHGHGEGNGHSLHLGFIEEWYIVNPAAALGILIAFVLPRTKSPHALHVLISTWASSAHILMNSTGSFSVGALGGVFVVLFIAVWLPCCISDIIFPLLFVKSDLELTSSCVCTHHEHHSHKHIHRHSDKCHGGDNS